MRISNNCYVNTNILLQYDACRMAGTAGASHGLAAFVTLLIGTILSKFVWDLAPPIGEVALRTTDILRSTTGMAIPVNEQFAGTLVVMVGLSFVWGVVYHLGRHS